MYVWPADVFCCLSYYFPLPSCSQIVAQYRIIPNIRRGFLFQILLLEKEESLYFRILKNKFEEDDYEQF
jgi:hypothetical protein